MSTATAELEMIPLRAWLKQHSISKSSFYRRAAEMPPIIKIGRATYVPRASAKEWMAARVRPAATLSQSARA
jgi:predicted DNA-binding transcriptional regulator AlpA